jgi:acyl-CoA thioesterase-1
MPLRRFCSAALLWLGLLTAVDAQNTTPMPAAAPRTILFFGDSLTAGYGLDNPAEEAFPALIQQRLRAAGLKDTVINAGLSGDTSAGGLRRIDWLLRRPIDILVLELGGNDGLRGLPVDATRRNLQGIIDKTRAKNPGVRVIVAGMRMPPNFGADYTASFAEVFPALVQANPGAVLIPFLLEGVGGIPQYNQADQIHPTAAGDRIIADLVWKALEPLLK